MSTNNIISNSSTTQWMLPSTISNSTLSYNYTFPTNTWTTGTVQTKGNDIILHNSSGSEVLRLNINGEVTWAPNATIDEAAKALSSAMSLGAEFSAGFKNGIKSKIRDKIFQEIINMSKETGYLTTGELTNIFEASKIMEKLKGIGE